MDFLDPRKKRAHKIRLLVGYFLMAIVIGLSTIILVYGAYGYGINTKTGQIIENGLLFVDSKPGGADVYLNGTKQSGKTAVRLVLSAGDYTLSIRKSGYHSWQRSFVLDEHTISRYVYPFLFPVKPQLTSLKSYSSLPALATETPDRHWLLVQSDATADTLSFDEYDTGTLSQAPLLITLPKSVLTTSPDVGSFKEVEWSTDNNHLLLERTYSGGHEFIVLNRDKPDQSFNVNKLFSVAPAQVALRNKKADQLYLYDANGSLQVGDVGQVILAPPFLKNVLAFKPYGSSLISYVTDVGAPAGKVTAKIWDDGKIYPMYTFTPGSKYLLDIAQFQNHFYFVAGSNTANRINVFKDPEDYIRDPSYGKAVPMLALDELGATDVNFSENTRFIGVQAGQNFAVYDLETQDAYHYAVKSPISGPLRWMDGHRWIGQSGNSVYVVDYDNTNAVLVTPTVYSKGGFFSQDYNQMITFAPVEGASTVTLQRVDLRAGTDLPANGKQ